MIGRRLGRTTISLTRIGYDARPTREYPVESAVQKAGSNWAAAYPDGDPGFSYTLLFLPENYLPYHPHIPESTLLCFSFTSLAAYRDFLRGEERYLLETRRRDGTLGYCGFFSEALDVLLEGLSSAIWDFVVFPFNALRGGLDAVLRVVGERGIGCIVTEPFGNGVLLDSNLSRPVHPDLTPEHALAYVLSYPEVSAVLPDIRDSDFSFVFQNIRPFSAVQRERYRRRVLSVLDGGTVGV